MKIIKAFFIPAWVALILNPGNVLAQSTEVNLIKGDFATYAMFTPSNSRSYPSANVTTPSSSSSSLKIWKWNSSDGLFSSFNSYAFAKTGPKHPKGTFIFDPRNLRWAAYDAEGRLIRTGRASGGSGYCPDVNRSCHTPGGKFAVFSKGSANCKSSRYPLPNGGAPMPYCMFFTSNYAIHGSYEVPNYNASHGCIRVIPSDARWLHQSFIQHGTRVIVKPY